MRIIHIFSLIWLLFSCCCVNTVQAGEQKTVKIAAGGLLDGYYNIAIKLCRYISESNNGIKCEVIPTTGSLENLWLLQHQEVDFAFTLSDLAVQAYEGSGHFLNTKAFKEMYQVLRLQDQNFTVIVKDNDQILVFGDLEGKRISNGPPNSDSSVAYKALAAYYDFVKEPYDVEMSPEDYADAFCNGKIDAIMLMVGYPNQLVNIITHTCESDFVTVDSDKIDLLVKNNPGFHKVTLKAGEYPGITQDQDTVAVSSIFVAASSVDKKIVKNFRDYIESRINLFKSSDPVLYDLEDNYFTTQFLLPTLEGSDIK